MLGPYFQNNLQILKDERRELVRRLGEVNADIADREKMQQECVNKEDMTNIKITGSVRDYVREVAREAALISYRFRPLCKADPTWDDEFDRWFNERMEAKKDE